MKFNWIELVLLFIAIFWKTQSSTFTAVPNYFTGSISLISTLCETGITQQYYLATSTPLTTNYKSAGISIVGIQSDIVTSSLNFTSSITRFNSSHIIFKATCQRQTFLKTLNYHYIFIGTDVDFLDIYKDCFICGQKAMVDGSREYTFSLQQHSTANNSDKRILTSINALNASNYYDMQINIAVTAYMLEGDTKIYQKIQSHSQTYIVLICLTTLVYDQSINQANWNGDLITSIGKGVIDSTLETTQLTPENNAFLKQNVLFFGVSGIRLGLLESEMWTLKFSSGHYSDINDNFEANENILGFTVQYFHVMLKNCGLDKYVPSLFTCQTNCPSPLSLQVSTNLCIPCHESCWTCNGQQANQCTTCNSTLQFRELASASPSTCICMDNYLQPFDNTSLICVNCSTAIQHCLQCSSYNSCSLCSGQLQFNSTSEKCQCINSGQYPAGAAGDECHNFPGCIMLVSATNTPAYCSQCDTNKNFKYISSNDSCVCKDLYVLNDDEDACIDQCGDGVILDNQCDDANTIDGDGCSSQCLVQDGYSCFYNLDSQKSICPKNQNFTITYQFCQRDITQNKADLYFLIEPIYQSLALMDLSADLEFSFSTTSTSTTYDSSTGQLKVTTAYSQTLEGTHQSIELGLDPNLFSASSRMSVNFQVIGSNSWVTYDQNCPIYSILLILSIVICCLTWTVGIIASILGYKHIGLELILPIQTIYFCLICANSKSPGVLVLQYLKLINGYSYLNGLELKESTSEDDKYLFYQQFAQNHNWMIVVGIGILILVFILKAISVYLRNQAINSQFNNASASEKVDNILKGLLKQQNKKNKNRQLTEKLSSSLQDEYQKDKVKSTKKQKFINYLVYRILQIILYYSILPSFFYSCIAIAYYGQAQVYSEQFNVVACIISFCIGIASWSLYPSKDPNQKYFTISQKIKFQFHNIYIGYYIVLTVLLAAFFSIEIQSIVLMPATTLIILLLVFILKNPYRQSEKGSWVQKLPLVQCIILLVPIGSLIVATILNASYQNQMIYLIISLSVITCSILATILAVLRTVMEYRSNYSSIAQRIKQLDKTPQEIDKDFLSLDTQDRDLQKSQKIQKPFIDDLLASKDHKEFINWQKNNIQNYEQDKLNNIKQEKDSDFEKLEKKTKKKLNIDQDHNSEYEEEDVQAIKKRLRKDLMVRRGKKKL